MLRPVSYLLALGLATLAIVFEPMLAARELSQPISAADFCDVDGEKEDRSEDERTLFGASLIVEVSRHLSESESSQLTTGEITSSCPRPVVPRAPPVCS